MNLIICCTPLQVLIAEKIIEKHPGHKFIGVMFGSVWDSKRNAYFNRLTKICQSTIKVETPTQLGKWQFIKALRALKSALPQYKFENVFLANLNSLWVQSLISHIHFQHLYTFDDGIGNIFPNFPILDESKTIKYSILKVLSGIKYSAESLRIRSEKHYTIYPKFKNIIDNIEAISLFEQNESFISDKAISLFIGQPIYPTKEENQQLMMQVFKDVKIDYYFPHPAENYRFDGINYIDSDLIFEDYLVQKLVGRKVVIYTFFSSVAFNVLNDPNIEVHFLELNLPRLRQFYEFMKSENLSIYKEISL